MIAIIAAMSEEVEAVTSIMTNVSKEEHSGLFFHTGKLSNKEVVVLQCGVGKVAAAIGATVLLEHYDVSSLINVGVAGGLLAEQEVLDVVVSTMTAYHDVEGPDDFFPKGYESKCFCYDADKTLIDAVSKVINESDRVFIGPVATGDSFVYLQSQVDKILKEYPESICAEMEGAAIAQVAAHYQKPFVIIRSLSDVAVKEGNKMQYEEFVCLASKRSAVWLEKIVEKLSD